MSTEIFAKNALTKFRSTRPKVFCNKCVLKNFEKFTGNAGARVSFLFKKSLWHRYFFVNFPVVVSVYLQKSSS